MRLRGECCHTQYYSLFLWVFLCVGYLDRHHPSLEWTDIINSGTKEVLSSVSYWMTCRNDVHNCTGTAAVWTNSVVIICNQRVWSTPLHWQLHSQKCVHPAMQSKCKEHFLPVFRVTVLDFSFCKHKFEICILPSLDGSPFLPSPLALFRCLCPQLLCLQERKKKCFPIFLKY